MIITFSDELIKSKTLRKVLNIRCSKRDWHKYCAILNRKKILNNREYQSYKIKKDYINDFISRYV